MPKMKYTTYQELIKFAEKECDSFSLVWRHEFDFKDSAWKVEEDLQPHLKSEIPTNKWPGTENLKGAANVCTYSLNQKVRMKLRIFIFRL